MFGRFCSEKGVFFGKGSVCGHSPEVQAFSVKMWGLVGDDSEVPNQSCFFDRFC